MPRENRDVTGRPGFVYAMAIVGLLAGTLAACKADDVSAAKVAKTRADLESLRAGLDLYKLDTSRYPTSAQGLHSLVSPPPEVERANPDGYLGREVPRDAWGRDFVYVGDGKTFTLTSLGADGAAGGTGAGADIEITSQR